MKRRIITLGLLASVMLTSCVDENESAAVQGQREALVKKMEAEASKATAEAQIKEYEAAIVALNKAVREEQQPAEIAAAQAQVEATKNAVEKAKLQAELDLAKTKQDIKEAKVALDKQIADFDGTDKANKLATVKEKMDDYTAALVELENKKIELIAAEQAVVVAQNDHVQAGIDKDREIAELQTKIAGDKDLIETLKSYEQYAAAGNLETLKLEKKKAEDKVKAAQNTLNLKLDELKDVEDAKTAAEDAKTAAADLLDVAELDFFKAITELEDKNADYINGTNGFSSDDNTLTDGEFSEDYMTYVVAKLPSVDTERVNLRIQEIKNGLTTFTDAVTAATDAETSAKAAYDSATADYNANPSDSALLAAKQSALDAYDAAKEAKLQAVQDKKDASGEITELEALKASVNDSKAEVVALIEDFNAKSKAEAEAKIAYAKEEEALKPEKDAVDAAQKEVDVLAAVVDGTNAQGVEDIQKEIEALEDGIREDEETIADLQGVDSAEALIEVKKAEVEKIKVEISEKEAEVAAKKSEYETALAALNS